MEKNTNANAIVGAVEPDLDDFSGAPKNAKQGETRRSGEFDMATTRVTTQGSKRVVGLEESAYYTRCSG